LPRTYMIYGRIDLWRKALIIYSGRVVCRIRSMHTEHSVEKRAKCHYIVDETELHQNSGRSITHLSEIN
jgi:hypothetical protein